MDENPNVVNKELTTPNEVLPPVAPVEVTPSVTPPGSKTPPDLLLKSLQEERDKVKKLEDELNNLKSTSFSNNPSDLSDEARILNDRINALNSNIQSLVGQVETLTSESSRKDVLLTYPVLKDKWAEFENYRSLPENKGMNIKTAAKAFLTDNGILEQPRKGLEPNTGGPRVTPSTGMTSDQVADLRKNNFKEYQKKLAAGEITITDK